ncbi:MAG: haloacid dehalogenase-like hydrolase [Bacteroidales bacterium]|jgi:HAD superfamily hydrolase (TIGR01490 family)|nr:haloacid dehalogenase-like hydrolase [Bacteroidales bacterium]
MDKIKLVAFDFDGTITTKDTLLQFIIFSKGVRKFVGGTLFFSPLIIAYYLKIYPNWKLKQKIFSYFFKGVSLIDFNRICKEFANAKQHLIKQKAIEKITEYRKQHFDIIIISASIENWVLPFANRLGITNVICTKIEKNDNNIITGKFSTRNCNGKEKVDRLLEKYPDREKYFLTVYGDSRGDYELLKFADEKYYKTFK